jgi:hypothetical protein
MVDNPKCQIPLGEKYSRLLKYRDGWDQIDWSASQSSSRLHVMWQHLQVVDGILVSLNPQQTEGGVNSSLTVMQLPGVARGIEHTSWTISHPLIGPRLFGISPTQDLIVVLQLVNDTTIILHPLTLSAAKPHPQAYAGPIQWSLNHEAGSVSSKRLLISGDWVTVRLTIPGFPSQLSHLAVFNWKTGINIFVS